MTVRMLGPDATATYRRLWLVIEAGADGKPTMRVSTHEPVVDGAMAVIRAVGQVADNAIVALDVEGPDGPNGWTPMLQAEADGTRTLVKVADWIISAGKPGTGYLTAGGSLTNDKSAAFNFNSVKRVDIFGGTTGAGGIATIAFAPAFAAAPAKALPSAVPNVLAGPVKAEIVTGSLTRTGCQVRVTTTALVTGVVSALVGASVSVIAIEA